MTRKVIREDALTNVVNEEILLMTRQWTEERADLIKAEQESFGNLQEDIFKTLAKESGCDARAVQEKFFLAAVAFFTTYRESVEKGIEVKDILLSEDGFSYLDCLVEVLKWKLGLSSLDSEDPRDFSSAMKDAFSIKGISQFGLDFLDYITEKDEQAFSKGMGSVLKESFESVYRDGNCSENESSLLLLDAFRENFSKDFAFALAKRFMVCFAMSWLEASKLYGFYGVKYKGDQSAAEMYKLDSARFFACNKKINCLAEKVNQEDPDNPEDVLYAIHVLEKEDLEDVLESGYLDNEPESETLAVEMEIERLEKRILVKEKKESLLFEKGIALASTLVVDFTAYDSQKMDLISLDDYFYRSMLFNYVYEGVNLVGTLTSEDGETRDISDCPLDLPFLGLLESFKNAYGQELKSKLGVSLGSSIELQDFLIRAIAKENGKVADPADSEAAIGFCSRLLDPSPFVRSELTFLNDMDEEEFGELNDMSSKYTFSLAVQSYLEGEFVVSSEFADALEDFLFDGLDLKKDVYFEVYSRGQILSEYLCRGININQMFYFARKVLTDNGKVWPFDDLGQ